jgi:hypothetical protein
MQHPDEKPTTDVAENSIACELKHAEREKFIHRLRSIQAIARRAESPKAGISLGYPKRRKPSMPKMPWDKEVK